MLRSPAACWRAPPAWSAAGAAPGHLTPPPARCLLAWKCPEWSPLWESRMGPGRRWCPRLMWRRRTCTPSCAPATPSSGTLCCSSTSPCTTSTAVASLSAPWYIRRTACGCPALRPWAWSLLQSPSPERARVVMVAGCASAAAWPSASDAPPPRRQSHHPQTPAKAAPQEVKNASSH
eukprot:364443-Chlamydomonas_euryale.AAC.8